MSPKSISNHVHHVNTDVDPAPMVMMVPSKHKAMHNLQIKVTSTNKGEHLQETLNRLVNMLNNYVVRFNNFRFPDKNGYSIHNAAKWYMKLHAPYKITTSVPVKLPAKLVKENREKMQAAVKDGVYLLRQYVERFEKFPFNHPADGKSMHLFAKRILTDALCLV